ncbi:MAG TPA: EAL domain-containing protein [Solirubrobacteraceae bacterium]|nr:EAL domain-containing protein [Solirubrobacteraceae bacterium]
MAALYLAGPLGVGPVYNLLGASSAAAIAVGVARHRPRAPIAWWLIALGQALFVCGDVLAYNYETLFGRALPFPSVADPLYLAMYPCLAGGLLVLARRRGSSRDRAGVLDALIVASGLGTLSWAYLMAPYAHDATLTLAERLTSMAYPLADLVLLAVAVRLLLGARHGGASSPLLALGFVALLATDAVYGWLSINGGYTPGGLLDVGWIAFYVLCGAAALHPSMRVLSEPAPAPPVGLTRRRLALLAATSLLAPGLQLVRAALDQPREPLIAVAAGVLFLLVLARLTGLARSQESLMEHDLRRRFETRLAALVRNAQDVVSLLGPDGRLAYLSPSASTLTGRSADELMETSLLDLVHPDDAADVLAFLQGLGPGESGSAVFRLRHANGIWRDVEALATNLIADEMVGGIVLNTRDVSERTALERRLEHQAFHDALTSLPNRDRFQDRVQHAFARLRRHGTRFAVLFLDLDDFKTVNDSLGHAAGDAVLREVAARLDRTARTTDSAARLGGDEFALLVDGIRDELEAVAVAERVMEAISRPIALDGHEFTTTPSIGIAFATPGAGADELLRDADAAMYLAKAQGKGRYAIFQPAMHAAAMERLQLKADLQKAVRDGDISLVYQPVVDLRRGEIVGVEALARWFHEERGPVSPAEFIPLAEETGLVVAMGAALLREACHQAAVLQAACPREPALTMSVNLSARQLQSPGLVGEVRDALRQSGIPPSSLVLELTESAMIEDVELVTARLEELRALGVSLAIDDFGTGYSSLTYIRRFPVDVLKIDRSFIDGVGCGSELTEALTASILQLAGVLSLKPVAEGIEHAAQLARLVELGCELGQGYHLHAPLGAAAVEALVRAQAAASAAA